METLSFDAEIYAESDLVDASALPLSELSLWRTPEIRAAMRDVVRGTGELQVWEERSCTSTSDAGRATG